MTRKALTKHQILGAQDQRPAWVDTPEWGEGGGVYVRGLTAAERSIVMAEALRVEGAQTNVDLSAFFRGDLLIRIVAMVAVDEDGKRIFAEADVADLGGKAPEPMDRIVAVALNRSGMTAQAMAEVDADLKAPSGDSPTGSALRLAG